MSLSTFAAGSLRVKEERWEISQSRIGCRERVIWAGKTGYSVGRDIHTGVGENYGMLARLAGGPTELHYTDRPAYLGWRIGGRSLGRCRAPRSCPLFAVNANRSAAGQGRGETRNPEFETSAAQHRLESRLLSLSRVLIKQSPRRAASTFARTSRTCVRSPLPSLVSFTIFDQDVLGGNV